MPFLKDAQHELFAQSLAAGFDQTDSYEMAGYASDAGHASRLARNGKVKDRVQELLQNKLEETKLDEKWVLDRLMENAERSLQHRPAKDKSGAKVVGVYKYNGQVANQALKLLGMTKAMFVDVVTEKNDVAQMLEAARQRRLIREAKGKK